MARRVWNACRGERGGEGVARAEWVGEEVRG